MDIESIKEIIISLFVFLEVLFRVIPTKKEIGFIKVINQILDYLIPNRIKKD